MGEDDGVDVDILSFVKDSIRYVISQAERVDADLRITVLNLNGRVLSVIPAILKTPARTYDGTPLL
jgi:hypothetical protein